MMKCNSKIKILHLVVEIFILLSILALIIFDLIQFLKCCDIQKEIIPLICISLSFIILIICFTKNVLNDYKKNLGFCSILRFITYCFLLTGFILRKKETNNNFVYKLIGLISLGLLLLNFFLGFLIGDSTSTIDNIFERSIYSMNYQSIEANAING